MSELIVDKVLTIRGTKEDIYQKYYRLFSGTSNLSDVEVNILSEVNKNKGKWEINKLVNSLGKSQANLNNYKNKLVEKNMLCKSQDSYIINPLVFMSIENSSNRNDFRIMFILDPSNEVKADVPASVREV